MDKTRKSKQKRKIKTRRLLRGGKPDFIKIVAYHKDGLLVDYKIIYNNFENDDQKKYAKIHKVYYPIKGNNFHFDPKRIKIKSQNFFYPSNPLKMDKSDFQTIAIHHPDDIEKIEITNKIIQNINDDKTIQNSSQNYDGDKLKFIEEYTKFIRTNESTFLNGLSNKNSGRKLLNTPVFLNIIGTRYGFIKDELGKEEDLDEIKELMDAPMTRSSTATSSTATSSTAPGADVWTPKFKVGDIIKWKDNKNAKIKTVDVDGKMYHFDIGSQFGPVIDETAILVNAGQNNVSTRRKISNRLRDLIKKSSLKPL